MKKSKSIEAKAASKITKVTANAAEVANNEVAQATPTKEETPKAEVPTSKVKIHKKKVHTTPTAKEPAKTVDTKEAKKKKLVKEVAKNQKVSIVENVIAHREVKYIYPEDVQDTLSRKTWRQKTRNKLHQLELAMGRIKDENSKEYRKAKKEYEAFKAEVLKPEQVA